MPGIPHHEAKAYLNSYLDRKSDQGMAVLIGGHWGAGKTRFVTAYFDERRNRLSKNLGARQPPDYLYASFFGAPDEAAVADQFLSQLYPSLNSKLGKVLGTAAFRLGSALFNAAAQAEVTLESSDVNALREWAAHPRDRIVVFDDLERAGIGVERALALINGYVERDGIRVVVIANESEIRCEKYKAWKEKVVGKTLLICADADEVLHSIGVELDSGIVKNYLLSNISKVSEVVRSSTYPNFRSVRNLIVDAHRITSHLDRRLAALPGVVESLILFSVGIGAEFRAGKLTAAEILDQAQVYFSAPKEADGSRLGEVREIYSKYTNIGASVCLVPPDFLIALWDTGELKQREITEALATNPRVVGESATPAWRRLWSLWDLSQSSYERAKGDALELLERSEVTVEGELLHILSAALLVESYGAEFFPKQRAIEWLALYLQREKVRSKLNGTSIYHRVGSNTAHLGLGYAGKDLAAFKEAKRLITTTLREIDEERKVEGLNKYLDRLRHGDYESISLSGQWNETVPYGSWLHLVDPTEFAAILIDDGRVAHHLCARLISRYETDGNGTLSKEWAWLRQVKAVCGRKIASIDEPHRTICWIHLLSSQRNIRAAIGEAKERCKRRADP